MYRMGTGIAFTVCVIKCTEALIFFSFRIMRTSVNTESQTSLGGPQNSVLMKFYCTYFTFSPKFALASYL